MDYIERLKLLLNIYDQDELLTEIVNITKDKLLLYLELNTIPKELEWILIELSVKRFNRIGSEGMSSENTDGSNITYEDDELSNYTVYLDKYLEQNPKVGAKKGWCLF